MHASPPTLSQYFHSLGSDFYSEHPIQAATQPRWIAHNTTLAKDLGLDPAWLSSEQALAVLSGKEQLPGISPLAAAYSGHQFGNWNPQLGDGRALLLGECRDQHGQLKDIQVKGSGRTAWSRGGDGLSPLGPVLREYLVSEAMAALGVATTRALTAFTTGDTVMRETPLAGAVLCRVASSHIRVGSFQYFAARQNTEALKNLADHVISRHYPDCANSERPYLALFEAVIAAQAELIAQWQCLGFIHGVMNTDNMLVCGETIDYGPCAFMEQYHPGTVLSSIDQQGRYAYGNQPGIAHWNLSCLAQALLPLIDEAQDQAVALAQASLNRFPDIFAEAYLSQMRRKLGLSAAKEPSSDKQTDYDLDLITELLDILQTEALDFTLSFRALAEEACEQEDSWQQEQGVAWPAAMAPWLARWRERLSQESTQTKSEALQHCPIFIPRNHQVEAAISAGYQGDLSRFAELLRVVSSPYQYRSEDAGYARPASDDQRVLRTFCGT